MRTHAWVRLTPVILRLMHAEQLQHSICVRSLVLIAQAVFLLERAKQRNRHTDATERRTHAGGYRAGVGNKQ